MTHKAEEPGGHRGKHSGAISALEDVNECVVEKLFNNQDRRAEICEKYYIRGKGDEQISYTQYKVGIG